MIWVRGEWHYTGYDVVRTPIRPKANGQTSRRNAVGSGLCRLKRLMSPPGMPSLGSVSAAR